MTTLLHTCCGPCASACVPRLQELGRDVTMLFANSNIDTREEFEKRLAEAKKLAAADGVRIVALPYDHDEWLREVAVGYEHEPEKGARCERCFRYNLRKAAEYAAANAFDEFTTSLTVSPHKVSKVIFKVGKEVEGEVSAHATGMSRPRCSFFPEDFKKREGFKLSVRRAAELGLYRQSYCGCEFSHHPAPSTPHQAPSTKHQAPISWKLHHRAETVSTNLDARQGAHGDVFTADYQTAGRGRLDHKWISPPGVNLMMSVVLSVEGLAPDHVATLPLVAGLAVTKALVSLVAPTPSPATDNRQPTTNNQQLTLLLKWPNDVLLDGRKVAGILCERVDDRVIVGVGVNVKAQEFAPEIANSAISLGSVPLSVPQVRDAILRELGQLYGRWCEGGFAAVYPEIVALDFLRGQTLSVRQTDEDAEPICGVCGGILFDGALDVGGVKVYSGETHVEKVGF